MPTSAIEMKELVKQADELIAKINRMLDKHDKLVADLLVKDEEIRRLQQQLKEKTERIRTVEEEKSSLNLLESIQYSGGDTKEARKKLNEYIRELDRCIAKLSAEG